jgi:hypothetical protein
MASSLVTYHIGIQLPTYAVVCLHLAHTPYLHRSNDGSARAPYHLEQADGPESYSSIESSKPGPKVRRRPVKRPPVRVSKYGLPSLSGKEAHKIENPSIPILYVRIPGRVGGRKPKSAESSIYKYIAVVLATQRFASTTSPLHRREGKLAWHSHAPY